MPTLYALGLNLAGREALAAAATEADLELFRAALGTTFKAPVDGVSIDGFAGASFATAPGTRVVAQVRFDSAEARGNFLNALPSDGIGVGTDPVLLPADAWATNGPGGALFGNRSMARALIGADALDQDARGKGVNVVVLDAGLDREWLRECRRRRGAADQENDAMGWTRYGWEGQPGLSRRVYYNPGSQRSAHAEMIVRNILDLAPEATIWDVPLLPLEQTLFLPVTLSIASAILRRIRKEAEGGAVRVWDTRINASRTIKVDRAARWVLANAWFVSDPDMLDPKDAGRLVPDWVRNYADDPNHFLVNDMPRLAAAGLDVVFAAGNCGEPCPDGRCDPRHTGRGRSVLGANAHPDVLTVGAVRADGLPIGLSAEGPGRLAERDTRDRQMMASGSGYDYSTGPRHDEAREKPDLCAPSHFRDDDDATEVNTGTSAACAIAAGAIAALRSDEIRRGGAVLSPGQMRALLRESAESPQRGQWDSRLGHGVLYLPDALRMIRNDAYLEDLRGRVP